MVIDFLKDRFAENRTADAIVWREKVHSYEWLLAQLAHWEKTLDRERLEAGAVVVLEADYSADAIALFIALIGRGVIVVPLSSSVGARKTHYAELAQAEVTIRLNTDGQVGIERLSRRAAHPLYETLRAEGHPGLVLFSSGSTGESKAAVHDFTHLLTKFHRRRHNLRTLTFMQIDHIGGIDTLFYTLSNGSCVVTVEDRSPDSVCRAIERHRVEVLPVTPTFLNLLLLSGAYQDHDLGSLKYVTYGTEVMPEATLRRCAEVFPRVTLLQKYGTTEVGTLRSRSKSSDSLWVKIGGEGFQTRIVDGLLQIKAESAMLGYLNAPSPFTDDGWFITGDAVVQEGEFIRFLGRVSEIINVGGEKVYPAEVENVIQQIDAVAEVSVYGEANPLVGHIVCARVTPNRPVDARDLSAQIKRYCRTHMESYKVPVKVEIVDQVQHSARYKKMRSPRAETRGGPSEASSSH